MANTGANRRVLGIDVGMAITGWGILDNDNSKPKLVDYGVIETSKDDLIGKRLIDIHTKLTEVLKHYQPTEVAVESLFYFKNQTTVMNVSQCRGVILLTLAEANLPIAEYTPLQVKQSVTGYGRAEKKQMQKMVQLSLGMKEIPKPDDAADALGIALTHFFWVKSLVKNK